MNDNDPVAADIARHVAALLNDELRMTDVGLLRFHADSNGDLIHISTSLNGRQDAWVLTLEWDGER